MAFTRIKVTLLPLTLEFTKEIAAMCGVPGERPLRDSRLAFLDKERQEGRFIGPGWAVATETPTGQRYRLNGQHSSTMLARLTPEEFPVGLTVMVEEFETDDLARDALRMFNLYDHPKSVRTNTDIMNYYRKLYPELEPIDLGILVALCNGINQYEASRPNGVKLDPRDRGIHVMTPEIREFVVWAAGYQDAMHGWMLRKAGVVAEILANVKADKPVAQEFWDLAFNESHTDPEHESREVTRSLKELAPKPRVGQTRLQKEAAKFWRRYRRSIVPRQQAA